MGIEHEALRAELAQKIRRHLLDSPEIAFTAENSKQRFEDRERLADSLAVVAIAALWPPRDVTNDVEEKRG